MRPRSMELRAPRSLDEWTRYHDIRKRCIFNKYHGEGSARYFAYDPNCPHEHDPTDHPPLFLADGVVIGTVRIGIRPEGWACSDWSSSTPNGTAGGLGGPMLEMAERYARARGAGVICLNAVSDAFRMDVPRRVAEGLSGRCRHGSPTSGAGSANRQSRWAAGNA